MEPTVVGEDEGGVGERLGKVKEGWVRGEGGVEDEGGDGVRGEVEAGSHTVSPRSKRDKDT